MPYKSVEEKRAHQREYQRRRAREANPPAPFPELRPVTRLRTAHDVLDRIEAHLSAIEGDETLPTVTRARAARELLATALKALEITDLGGRLARLEELMKLRGIALPVLRPALPGPDAGDRGGDGEAGEDDAETIT